MINSGKIKNYLQTLKILLKRFFTNYEKKQNPKLFLFRDVNSFPQLPLLEGGLVNPSFTTGKTFGWK